LSRPFMEILTPFVRRDGLILFNSALGEVIRCMVMLALVFIIAEAVSEVEGRMPALLFVSLTVSAVLVIEAPRIQGNMCNEDVLLWYLVPDCNLPRSPWLVAGIISRLFWAIAVPMLISVTLLPLTAIAGRHREFWTSSLIGAVAVLVPSLMTVLTCAYFAVMGWPSRRLPKTDGEVVHLLIYYCLAILICLVFLGLFLLSHSSAAKSAISMFLFALISMGGFLAWRHVTIWASPYPR